jgi:hypothetical protein
MERRTPLRRTPFKSKQPAKPVWQPPVSPAFNVADAAAALAARERSRATPRTFNPPSAQQVPVSAKPKRTGFPFVVRQTILDRDNDRCQRCWVHVAASSVGYSLQHRIARGMGGTDDPAINRAGNGIVLCGSGTTGCHGWVEAHPVEAARAGWSVESWADPTSVPVKTPNGWLMLNDRGYSWPVPEPADGDAHTLAVRREGVR